MHTSLATAQTSDLWAAALELLEPRYNKPVFEMWLKPMRLVELTPNEIVLAVIGGLFVLEAVSVIVQVVSFKLTGIRVFRMAPIHHHYEQMGWTEPQIVIRFWSVAVLLALAGLATLKLR